MLSYDVMDALQLIYDRGSVSPEEVIEFLGKERLEAIDRQKSGSHPSRWNFVLYYLLSKNLVNMVGEELRPTAIAEIMIDYVHKRGGIRKICSRSDSLEKGQNCDEG